MTRVLSGLDHRSPITKPTPTAHHNLKDKAKQNFIRHIINYTRRVNKLPYGGMSYVVRRIGPLTSEINFGVAVPDHGVRRRERRGGEGEKMAKEDREIERHIEARRVVVCCRWR